MFKHKPVLYYLKSYKTYFISSPIYYPNDKPHIGHFYTNSIADIFARWNRLKGQDVIFSTGTDDHGIKMQKAAEKANLTSQQLADKTSNNFKTLFKSADFTHTDFIRTSENRHREMVYDVWNQLMVQNCMIKGKYSGWYSIVEECFIPSNSKVVNSATNPVEWCEEENWIFDLTKFKTEIRKWANSGVIYPSNFLMLVNQFIDETNHVSISRPSHRVKWGIPVPNDPDQTIYVWFDALINYLTVSKTQTKDFKPFDLQIIGKDIVRFHTVLWPAILLALGLELPKRILIHSHWLRNGNKMSKSLGNVVDPHEEALLLGGYEQLKYFLLSENAIENDSDYNTGRAIERINNHLVNISGNLLQRICGTKINPLQRIGMDLDLSDDLFSGKDFSELVSELNNLRFTFENHMDNFNIHFAIDAVINVLRQTNAFFDYQKPWRSFEDPRIREAIIYVASESLRLSAILFQCVIPQLSDKILGRISVPCEERTLSEMSFNRHGQNNYRFLQNFDGDTMLLTRLAKES